VDTSRTVAIACIKPPVASPITATTPPCVSYAITCAIAYKLEGPEEMFINKAAVANSITYFWADTVGD
jgi:hypothetical protein